MKLNIANQVIEINDSILKLQMDDYIKRFICDYSSPTDYYIDIEISEFNFITDGTQIRDYLIYELYDINGRMFIGYKPAENKIGFGFYLDTIHEDYMKVYVDKIMIGSNISYKYFVSLLGLHRHFFYHDAFILHCSYLVHDNEAILFLGSSGTGKSTQASLWNEYGNARIINGDRAVVRYHEDGFYAYGLPNCGSSNICLNESYRIKQIVILKQGLDNHIVKLGKFAKVKAIMLGIQTYPFDGWEIDQSLRLASFLASECDVCQLECTISKEAVLCLKNYMEER